MRKKFIVVTTIPASLRFFEGQLNFLNKTFEVMAISSDKKKLRRSWAERGDFCSLYSNAKTYIFV